MLKPGSCFLGLVFAQNASLPGDDETVVSDQGLEGRLYTIL